VYKTLRKANNMDEKLLKQVQDWTNQVPLIILGSGASVPYGMPSMEALGQHLSRMTFSKNEEIQKQFNEFKTALNKYKNLEIALSNINLNEELLEKIVSYTWKFINEKDIEIYKRLLQDYSSFPLINLISYLLGTTKRKLTIVTTNYDRLAEYAISIADAFIYNGFLQNFYGKFPTNIYKNDFSEIISKNTSLGAENFTGQVNLWKVHGSLDWFNKDDNCYNFPISRCIPENYEPLIVTPGNTKYSRTHLEPYRSILTEADKEISNASSILCIGYGFNDEHVQQKLIRGIKNGKPIIVITKELTKQAKDAIIHDNCKNYILFEQANKNDTRVYSPVFKEQIISDANYWKLEEYIELLK
jgi:hypothetical protein